MKWNPHLTFNGQCAAAFHFYQQCLGGEIVTMLTYAESPLATHTPPAMHDKILHATLALGDLMLTGADAAPESYQPPQGVSVLLHTDSPEEADRIFAALTEGGAIEMPIQQTFWAARFGMLVDQFGIPWMINCSAPSDAMPNEETATVMAKPKIRASSLTRGAGPRPAAAS